MVASNMHIPLSHWHLDTFLVERKDQGLKTLISFSIGADATVSGLEFVGTRFDKLAED